MFLHFLAHLRAEGVPVGLREHLAFLQGMAVGLPQQRVDGVYHLARAVMVKDERHFDRFDRAFGRAFGGIGADGRATPPDDAALVQALSLPPEWLERRAHAILSPDEMAEIRAMGGFAALMAALRDRLAEQQGRHQGGNRWVGTAGTSPFGAHGYNPEGVRIGQDTGRHGRAVKVWDQRAFADYDDDADLGPRGLKLALRRLRAWARDGAADEFDLDGTIHATATQGWLDLRHRPTRKNRVKVLMFLDVGGSMDPHVATAQALFSAARAEFSRLEVFYFHNCLYGGVWRGNERRWQDQTATLEVMRRYGPDHRVIFVGDAAMSPYELTQRGGASEHWNDEAGAVWLARACAHWPRHLWINPVAEASWAYTQTTPMIAQIFGGRMVPLTVQGVARGLGMLR